MKCARPTCPNKAPKGYRGYCQKHSRSLGLVHEKVDATPTKTTIQRLLDDGWSYHGIADSAGLSHSTIRHIMIHDYPTVRRGTHDAIQRMELQPVFVPSWRSARRVQALRAAGFTTKEIAEGVGSSRSMIEKLSVEYYETTSVDLFERVDAFYRQHAADPVRPAHPKTAKRGWALPMEWDDIDDPQEQRSPFTQAQKDDQAPITEEDRWAAAFLVDTYGSQPAAADASACGIVLLRKCVGTVPGGTATREALRRLRFHAAKQGWLPHVESVEVAA